MWCAVSSRPQAEPDKMSLPTQREAGEVFARALSGEVVAHYEVAGHTRDYWSWFEAEKEMPAYRQVREDLQAGKLDVIHCVDSDRLGRDPALIHQFYSLAERNNCEIYDASMPHVVGQQTMGHRYGMAVKSVGAGEDQRRRVYRHRTGMRGRVRRGLHPGRWPLGYEPIRDRSGEVVGAEFTDLIGAISLMTRMFLEGHSYGRIAEVLRSSVWELPGESDWYENLVRRVLQSDVYAGYVAWGEARNPEPSEHFPALWDRATFAAILREREARKGTYRHPRSGPLRGVVVCRRCGGSMSRQEMSHRPGEYYLRCSRHSHKGRWGGNRGCHPNIIPEGDVLYALGLWLGQFADPRAVEEALAQGSGEGEIVAEMEQATKSLDQLEAGRRRLALAFADGKMDVVVYHEADTELRGQQDAAEARLAELRTILASRPDPELRRRQVEKLLAVGLDLRQAPPDRLSSALHRAGVRVYIENGEVLFCAFAA